jgi:hypothetical protein
MEPVGLAYLTLLCQYARPVVMSIGSQVLAHKT